MKSTLVKMGLLVAALAIAAFAVNREEAPPAPKSLDIDGFATAADLEAEKGRGILDGPADIAYPVDEIVITRGGETTRMVRTGEGKDLTWALAEPMVAAAVKYRVEKMVKVFKDKTSSVHTKTIKAGDHPLFDFEASRRIAITLKAGGAVWNGVDLIVGRVEESESQAAQGGVAKDTWVMVAGDETTAYRMGGKDLRTDFDAKLSDLRDKKLFTVKGDDLVHIEATAPDGAKVVLDGERTETPAAEEGKPAKVTVKWTMTAPSGFQADESVKTFARNIANARTKAFVAAAEGPKEGLGEATWHVTARTHDGQTIGVRLAADGDPAWGQVDGREEWVQIEAYSAKNLRQGVAELRDKTLWLVPEADITSVTFGAEEGKPVTATRDGGPWTLAGGAPADLASHLRHLATTKAKRYATKAEVPAATAALANPAFTATVQTAKTTITLTAGAEIADGDNKGNRWARVSINGQPGEPALVASFAAKRFLKKAEDLKRKTFFDLKRDAIQRVEVIHPGGAKVTLERSAESGKLELLALPEGKKTRHAAVGTMVGTLPNLKAKAFEPATRPKAAGLVGESAYHVEVTDVSGGKHALLVSTETSGQDPYAMALTGPLANQVATINNFQAINLQKKAAELTE